MFEQKSRQGVSVRRGRLPRHLYWFFEDLTGLPIDTPRTPHCVVDAHHRKLHAQVLSEELRLTSLARHRMSRGK